MQKVVYCIVGDFHGILDDKVFETEDKAIGYIQKIKEEMLNEYPDMPDYVFEHYHVKTLMVY